MTRTNERGIAMITTLLVMMLISALLVGFTTIVMTDQRYRFIDKDRAQAFYGAAAGVEKMTADLGTLFLENVAPTLAQVTALTATANQPVIAGVTYTALNQPTPLPASEVSIDHCYTAGGITRQPWVVGGNGYAISFCQNTSTLNPTTLSDSKTITQGTYAGLYALKSPYQIDVTAKTASGGEVHLVRTMETVSIPVFQFGIFSDVDLAFNAASAFAFGGRTHTNGNLFLSQAANTTLTMSDKVDAYGQVVRQVLSNGNAIANNSDTGTVSIAKGGGAFRSLGQAEGSVISGPTSAYNAAWATVSPAYNGYLKDGDLGNPQYGTGAKQLTLPIVATGVGGTNIDLLRRPLPGESVTSILFGERMFNKASIRIILSDTVADIQNIPGIDNTVAPQSLEAGAGPFPPAPNAFSDAIPIAQSPGQLMPALTNSPLSGAGRTLTFAALPATWTAGNMTASFGVNTWTVQNCTTKTQSSFTGCTVAGPAGGIPNGATLSGAGCPTCTGGGATATVNGAVALGPGMTVNTVGNATLGFSPSTFWWNDQKLTCYGYTATSLTGCTIPSNFSAGDLIQNYVTSPQGTSLMGGYIKVERLNAANSTWQDMTAEMLSYGIAAPQLSGTCAASNDPTPNAIIRLQRLADDYGTDLDNAGRCIASTSNVAVKERKANSYDYWPNALFDTRESWQRETAPTGSNLKVAGVMYYVMLDVGNLTKWFAGAAPYTVAAGSTGTLSKTDNGGYSVYFSDRRNNVNAAGQETGELGFEDNVNPLAVSDVPNGVLDAGEDVNANGTLDVYGNVPSCAGSYNYTMGNIVSGVTCSTAVAFTNPSPPTLKADLVLAAEPAAVLGIGRAVSNRPLFFRRALKLVNAKNIVANVTGFTVVSENPVYVHGDYNANAAWVNPDAACAILADAVTILTNAWNDLNSFSSPYASSGRVRTPSSWYRFAILAGKNPIFPLPANQASSYPTWGTDGGAHAFLRYMEGTTNNNDTINYQGSMATMFYSRQAVGIFKGNGGFVYGIPATRNYAFDQNFLVPSQLPPLTPMFRDNDAVGFSQQLQPGK